MQKYWQDVSKILNYIFITGVIRVSRCEERASPLDINELFPSLNEADQYAEVPADAYRNISLDIEKLDINKFKNKMIGEMQPKLREEDRKLSESGRRFAITWTVWNGWYIYKKGFLIMINQLNCDMMLQLIYMAKGQISTVENSPNVDTEDTGYRVGYMSNKCQKIFKKMGRIMAFMKRWQYSLDHPTGHIVLHHRTVRLHIDFLYYYWVLNKLDAVYRQRFDEKYKPRLPPGDEVTGGISVEGMIAGKLPAKGSSKGAAEDPPPGSPGPGGIQDSAEAGG